MALTLSAEVVTLHTKHPFVIARGGRSAYEVVWVRLTDGDGIEGWGEASPSSRARPEGREDGRVEGYD